MCLSVLHKCTNMNDLKWLSVNQGYSSQLKLS